MIPLSYNSIWSETIEWQSKTESVCGMGDSLSYEPQQNQSWKSMDIRQVEYCCYLAEDDALILCIDLEEEVWFACALIVVYC